MNQKSALISFIVSENAERVTGQIIHLEGGFVRENYGYKQGFCKSGAKVLNLDNCCVSFFYLCKVTL